MIRQKITPCLWFGTEAEEAAAFYTAIFPDSSVERVVPGPGGDALVVEFRLAGQAFVALNGGSHAQFTEAVSLSVDCADQTEVDYLWERLSAEGTAGRCGWLKDRYGLSWQIVPAILPQLLSDPKRAARVMPVLMQMTKLNIQQLQEA